MRSTREWRSGIWGRRRTRALVAFIGAGTLVTLGATAGTAAAAPVGSRAAQPRAVTPGTPVHLTKVRTVNFGALARAARQHSARPAGAPRAMPRRIPSFVHKAAARGARAHARIPHVARATGFAGNVRGEKGFNGIDHTANENNFGFDISPPDHALGVGSSSRGPIIIQSLNLSLQAFTRSGHPLTPPIGANTFMGLGPCTANNFPVNCPSDPRVYWDPQTRHWFITDFTFSDSPLGEQFIAVSNSTNGLGSYTIFSLPAGAGFIDPSDCPCEGDFDMIGADNNGFYLEVQEFGQTTYHGAVIFAVSKRGLIAAANGGTTVGFIYTVPTEADPFGGFRIAPTSTTQGSRFPNTEYFVENDANLFSNTSLEVWALLRTGTLNGSSPTAPPLVETSVETEGYSIPPPATQKSGPIPFGNSVGALVAQPVDSGFETQQDPTFASGNLYVQLGTGVQAGGAATRSGLAWVVLKPKPGASSISVKKLSNGYVAAKAQLIYPSIAVNSHGVGWMAFTVTGADHFPSAAYNRFNGVKGAVGPIHIAKAGTTPLDDFTCYPGSGNGPTCRFGDYSASQFFNGRTFMGVEYIHNLTDVAGGADTNWATRVFSLPATP
ncbi:MAG: hypothetical protein ACTHKL_02485 [Streptosporangiaceae bacterium]